MPNYIKTGSFTNAVTPPGTSAAFLNAVENVLSQPTGGTETGKCYLKGSSYVTAANMGQYMSSLSRTAVPVSVVIDETDFGHVAGNANPAVTGNLTANGFLVYSSGNGVQTLWQVAGNTTINF